MEITATQREALMVSLIATLPKPRRPDGFTIREFAKRGGMAYQTAKAILEELEIDGKIKSEQNVIENGRTATVYYKPEEKSPQE